MKDCCGKSIQCGDGVIFDEPGSDEENRGVVTEVGEQYIMIDDELSHENMWKWDQEMIDAFNLFIGVRS